MENRELLSYVDHTLLKADADWLSIALLAEQALQYSMAAVCIPPSYVARLHEQCGSTLTIATVIGFPLGYDNTATKLTAIEQAMRDGAREVDMVINLGDVKDSRFEHIRAEIAAAKQLCGQTLLKVIVETCYLTPKEKLALCHCVAEGGADFIKTSTGFGPAGARIEDVRLFKQELGTSVQIKAAGGIRNRAMMLALIEAGATRLGMSTALQVLELV